jgi:precorrin-3B C17-methyltransferase
MNYGDIYVVGIGPGDESQLTPAALKAIEYCDVVVGYKTYLDLIDYLLCDKTIAASSMRKERERCSQALEYALEGENVALISGGDPGIYGMAGLMLETVEQAGCDINVRIVPGITAANAAAALLGAPLMNDFAVISLSDLMTPWETIERRVRLVAEGDFVIALYNPASTKRRWQIETVRHIVMQYRTGDTPVGIVRNAVRPEQEVIITNLEDMLKYSIDMASVVIVGNNATYVRNGYMITPRGYHI